MTLKTTELDSASLAKMVKGGCALLGNNKDAVNALNVFPVPDGDTGINMYLTVSSAVKNIQGKEDRGIGVVAGDFAMGALMGARGNSGVILSQMFRGFSLNMSGKKKISATQLAAALQRGVDLSYKSVMKPVEGTMLTVFREFAAGATEAAEQGADIIGVLEAAMVTGKVMLAETQNILPALKEAGVVDAGGKGLLFFLEGCLMTLRGQDIPSAEEDVAATAAEQSSSALQQEHDIEFAYCTQLLIKGQKLPIETIRTHLSQDPPGDSLLVVGDESVIKIHFHNNHPGKVLEYCAQFGSIHDIIIDNMRDQHHQNMVQEEARTEATVVVEPAAPVELSHCAVISVCSGEGMKGIFESLGASVISGGQTMNPSAEELLKAIAAAAAAEVVLLPNNSNIILTAQQAQKLAKKSVQVIESKFVTQGITAMLPFDKDASAEENAEAMRESLTSVVSGEITFAVRPAKYNGFTIEEGDILALKQGKIVGCGRDIGKTVIELLHNMADDAPDSSLISLFYGNDMSKDEAEVFKKQIEADFPDHEVELAWGGQPLYYFLISIE